MVKDMHDSFFGLLDTNVQKIKNTKNKKDLNTQILAVIKLLLEQLEYQGNEISKLGKLEIRKIFSNMGEVSEKACAFYEAAKSHLDSEANAGRIGQRLRESKDKLEAAKNHIESLDKQEAELQETEAALLRRLRESKDKLEAANNHIESLSKQEAELQETEAALLKKQEAQKQKVLYLQNMKEKIKDIDLKALKEQYESYRCHLGEDSSLVTKLSKYGLRSAEDVLERADKIQSLVNNELKEFDNILRILLETQESMKEEIIKRQNINV